jgi:hypothetical protein
MVIHLSKLNGIEAAAFCLPEFHLKTQVSKAKTIAESPAGAPDRYSPCFSNSSKTFNNNYLDLS